MTEKEPQVFGYTKADVHYWLHHPMTKLMMRYLGDKQKFFEQTALQEWLQADRTLEHDLRTMRGQVIELIELQDFSFDHLLAFYQSDEDREVGSQTDQDPTR